MWSELEKIKDIIAKHHLSFIAVDEDSQGVWAKTRGKDGIVTIPASETGTRTAAEIAQELVTKAAAEICSSPRFGP